MTTTQIIILIIITALNFLSVYKLCPKEINRNTSGWFVLSYLSFSFLMIITINVTLSWNEFKEKQDKCPEYIEVPYKTYKLK